MNTSLRPVGTLSRVLFHAGCAVMLLTAIAHTIAQLLGESPPANEQERQLMDLLTHYKLQAPLNRPMIDLFNGFGYYYSLSLLFFSVLGWVILCWAKADARLFRAICSILALASLLFTINSILNFFIIPTTFHALATLLFIPAFALASRSKESLS